MLSSRISRIGVFLLLILAPCIGIASDDPRTSYRSYIDVLPGTLTIPMVLEVPLPPMADKVLVYEQSTDTYLSSTVGRKVIPDGITYQVAEYTSTDGIRGQLPNLVDTNYLTEIDLLVVASSTESEASFTFVASSQVGVSELNINYAQSSAQPKTVTVYAPRPGGGEELVIRSYGSGSRNIVFPERFGQTWRVVFSYDQPVRISDVSFGPVRYRTEVDAVRFLAQPNQTYRVYLSPERTVTASLRDGGMTSGVPIISPAYVSAVEDNPAFKPGDSDEDGVPDLADNCPTHFNPDQKSSRNTQKGDVCDDFDNDSVMNTVDNCEFLPNPDQLDTDEDGIGDVCDKSESRLTEQYPWLPWLGIGITLLVILSLFVSVARRPLPDRTDINDNQA